MRPKKFQEHSTPYIILQRLESSRCNPQLQSPLFNKIPPEIRNQVFAYVLAEQDSTAIPEDSYWYRPDYTHYRYIDTALLRTCRKIWLETYMLPRVNLTERIWLGHVDRQPTRILKYVPSGSERELYGNISNQTTRLWPCESVQVFAQMWALESGNLRKVCRRIIQRDILPVRRIVLTIRYTDWWHWESDSRLDIALWNWHTANMIPESVEEFVMELEMRNGKKDELEMTLNKGIRPLTFRSLSGLVYTLDESRTTRSTWVGSTTPGGKLYEHHVQDAKASKDLGEGKMMYYVVKMVWTKAEIFTSGLEFAIPGLCGVSTP